MRKDRNYGFLWIDMLIAAALLAFDQFTKYLAIVNLKGQPALVLIVEFWSCSILRTRESRSACSRSGRSSS